MLLNANETICPSSLLFLPLGPHPLGWAKYIVLQFCFLFPFVLVLTEFILHCPLTYKW
jgi:hypothetical protein